MARMVDTVLLWPFTLLVGLLIGLVSGLISPEAAAAVTDFAEWGPGRWIINAIVLTLCTFAYESVLLARFGTTLGKRLLGLQLRTAAGERPGPRAAVKRTLLVLVLGLGLFIPLVTAFTKVIGYLQFMERGRTPWDAATHLQIEKTPVASWRWAVGFGAWAVSAGSVVYARIDGL